MELLRFEMLLPAFGLVLARTAGVTLSVPMLASRQIPSVVKAWLAVTLALMTFPVVAPLMPQTLTLAEAAAGMVGEFIIGEVLGLGAGLVFMATQVAGKIISHQSGMALGQVFNPVTDASSTVLDQVWFFATLMFFLAMRGHLAVMHALLGSFKTVPPMTLALDGSAAADFLIAVLRSMFELALRMSGPAILALLLTSLLMGLLTKTMPQFNILSVGFSFKISTGLFMAAVTLRLTENLIADAAGQGLDHVGLFFERMAEAVTHGG